MTIRSRLHAALSDHVYLDREIGSDGYVKSDGVTLGGVSFTMLRHAENDLTGYQGRVYQRTDTGEIIVAHRGTEQGVDALADAGMIGARFNAQARDAIALTREALRLAREREQETGNLPTVTVTGHSLGGTLAQITAHHFNLKGETFNAYGAASLGLRIPSGGDTVINHVMATDAVSAASPHFGQVVVYATQQEISILAMNGYRNGWERFITDDNPLIVASSSMSAHKLDNFLGERSVLNSPTARALAERNQTMIAEYREDIGQRRLAVTAISRAGPGLLLDAVDAVRGPIQAGEPARAAQARQEKRAPQLSDPEHPAHGLFRSARVGVYAQDAKFGRTPDAASDRLAGALAAEIYALGGTQIDRVLVSKDGSRLFAVQGRLGDPANVYASVDAVEGLNTPLAQSTERVAQCAAPVPQQPTLLMRPEPELQADAAQQTRSPVMGGRGH